MTRKTIWLLCFLYFAAAAGFALFEMQQDTLAPSVPLAGNIGHLVGLAFSFWAMAAILPMIGWAIGGFKADNAQGPFVLWLIFGVGLAGLYDYGERSERNEKITTAMPNGVFAGKDRADFIRSAMLSCTQSQKVNPLTPKVGLTDTKIAAYCGCYANGMAAEITVDELRVMLSGVQPQSLVDKATALGVSCGKQLIFTR
jgi:hypothetical protein